MDFREIVLSDQELSLLEDIRDGRGTYADAGIDSLIRKGLVSPDFFIQSSDTPNPTPPEIILTDDGCDYLTYLDNINREKRKERHHNWVIALITLLLGALLGEYISEIIAYILNLIETLIIP